jgi:CRISPR/Cas system-associated exonuclease Cas4 (RecB family)
VHFKFLDAEFDGEKSYTVNGHTVKLRGRSDGKLGLLDENGDVSRIIGFEKKTKDKRKNLNKILKEGSPQDTHKKQAVAYALIWGITDWIFEYESLSKPEWSDINPDKEDIAHYFVSVSKEEAKELLLRLASVVEAIKEEKLPEPDLSKCGFCPFKNQCHKDGGYSFEEKKSSKK